MSFKYENKLGSGGFGEVWRVSNPADGKQYALKLLSDTDPDSLARFQKEVRLLQGLDHPNVVRVLWVQLHQSPFCYLMPLYKRSLMNEFPRIVADAGRIERVFSGVLEGVRYLHAQGVTHRDLKPENVLLNADDDIVISDLGLGRKLDAASTRLTRTGDRFGTFLYMAPEQISDAKRADHRADIYSLGRMLYELYAGELTSSVQDLSKLPPGVSLIVERATRSDPADRFQSVAEFIAAFRAVYNRVALDEGRRQLQEMVSQMAASAMADPRDIERLAARLIQFLDDPDEIHTSLMALPADPFGQMASRHLDATRKVISAFCAHFAQTGWGFDYTDKIAGTCERFYKATGDHEIRASLATGVLRLGVNHNRWFVMRTFAELLEAVHNDAEAAFFATRLASASSDMERVRGYLEGRKLHAPLRHFQERT